MDIQSVLGLSKDELREQVITRAVDEILDRYGEGFEQRGLCIFTERATQAAESMVKQKAEQAVMDSLQAVLDGVFQPVNAWGEKQGDPTTIRSLLKENMETFFTSEVNSKGGRPGYRDDKKTRAEWVAHAAVEEHLKGALRDELTPLIKEASKVLKAEVGEAIKDLVTRRFK